MATGFYLQNSLKLQSSIVYLPMQTHWLSAIMDFHFYPLYVFKWHLPKRPWRYVPSLFYFVLILQSSIIYLPMQTNWSTTIIDFIFIHFTFSTDVHLNSHNDMSPLLFLFCGNIAELNHVLAYANTLTFT